MEKYTYIRKTITWDSRRYEVRGKTEQEACEKLADLVVSLKRGEFAASGQTTVEQWFQQWMQTYKIPSGITPKSLACMTRSTTATSAPPSARRSSRTCGTCTCRPS